MGNQWLPSEGLYPVERLLLPLRSWASAFFLTFPPLFFPHVKMCDSLILPVIGQRSLTPGATAEIAAGLAGPTALLGLSPAKATATSYRRWEISHLAQILIERFHAEEGTGCVCVCCVFI